MVKVSPRALRVGAIAVRISAWVRMPGEPSAVLPFSTAWTGLVVVLLRMASQTSIRVEFTLKGESMSGGAKELATTCDVRGSRPPVLSGACRSCARDNAGAVGMVLWVANSVPDWRIHC